VTAVRSFLPSELVLAAGLAVIVEGGLFILLVTASNKAHITAREEPADQAIPIEVKPVLDEMPPLLKLGSKKKLRAKLPDMWAKKPPIKRFEAGSAPSPKAEATKEKIPETPVVKKDKEAPPPDAAIAKKVDEQPKTDEPPPKEQNLAEEGHEDGVKEGTETDPLKAFAVSQYKMKLSAWFNARFRKPTDIPCDELKKLKASVTASVSGDRTVTGFSITKPSGNATFDERVKSTMDSIVASGAELPPPPPNYAEVLTSSINTGFFVHKCD
jgi:outer membrane biosynthesis protein TonB